MSVISKRFKGVGLGLFLAVVLAAFLAATTARVEAEELKRVAERLVPFAPGGEIHIDDKSGRLFVEAWPRREVSIQITRVVRAPSRARAEELMKELEADVEVRSDQIRIESLFPKRSESIGFLDLLSRKNISLSINYYVRVPAETDLDLDTANGEVRVRGVSGRVDATTTNGDIRLEDVRGKVTLATTNGEVRLDDVTGDASANTTNGTVVADVRNVRAQGRVALQTTNGNVVAWFDKDLKADLDATTTNGRVSIGFPITRRGVMTSRTIKGTIQGGGAKITLGTTNGDVTVRPRNARGK